MQGFVLSALTWVLCSSIASAESFPPSSYTSTNNNVWRPDENASAQQMTPPAAQGQYQPPYNQPPAVQSFNQPPPNQRFSQYPEEIPQNNSAPSTDYAPPQRYDSGYYAYPQAQPNYWGNSPYPVAPNYPSGYYSEQPYSYPYVYEIAPPINEYTAPQGYGYPQEYGYEQEYYAPPQPESIQGYGAAYPPGYGPEYGAVPPYQEAPYDYPAQQPGPMTYPTPAPQQGYGMGEPQYHQGMMQQPQTPTDSAQGEWRPNTPESAAETLPQQVQRDNGTLINGAPAIFRPWTDPTTSTEENTEQTRQ